MEAVGRLAGASAHEFNNLLTVIRGNAALLMGEDLDPEARKDLAEIVWACERGAAFTAKLLLFTNRAWRKPRTVDLCNLLREMDLERRIPQGAAVCTELPRVPCRVVADPEHLEEAVLALVENAREAIHARGFVRVVLRPVTDRPEGKGQGPDWFRLEVADDGVGMDRHTAVRAPEPFFTTKTDIPGAGTGLSSAFGIIRQSGGCIRIDTAPGEGTRVHVWLPAAPRLQVHSD